MSKLVGVVAIVAVAVLIFALTSMDGDSAPAAQAAAAGPPANAEFVYDPPEAIIMAVGGARPGARGAAADSFFGLWVPSEGWEGEVIAADKSGFRIRRFDPKVPGGECFVTARCLSDPGVSVGQTVRVQGRIKDVSTKTVMASIVHNIELEQARTVSH